MELLVRFYLINELKIDIGVDIDNVNGEKTIVLKKVINGKNDRKKRLRLLL